MCLRVRVCLWEWVGGWAGGRVVHVSLHLHVRVCVHVRKHTCVFVHVRKYTYMDMHMRMHLMRIYI